MCPLHWKFIVLPTDHYRSQGHALLVCSASCEHVTVQSWRTCMVCTFPLPLLSSVLWYQGPAIERIPLLPQFPVHMPRWASEAITAVPRRDRLCTSVETQGVSIGEVCTMCDSGGWVGQVFRLGL